MFNDDEYAGWNIYVKNSDIRGLTSPPQSNKYIRYFQYCNLIVENGVNMDPLFLNAENPAGDDGIFGTSDDGLRLHSVSPCIDTGDNNKAPRNDANQIVDIFAQPVVDISFVGAEGVPIRDIGAYECSKPILFVDCNSTAVDPNGLSWAMAFSKLQDAITKAQTYDSDVDIWVAQGIYKPDANTDRNKSFQLQSGIMLYGGFWGGETGAVWSERDINRYETILSGDIGVIDNNSDNSYHVVTASHVDSSGGMDGFTIRDGKAAVSDDAMNGNGGGLYCEDDSCPTISNCKFINNNAVNLGGAAFIINSFSNIIGCKFIDNSAGLGGGGICNAFYSEPAILNCDFERNSLTQSGSFGAAIINDESNPLIRNSVFVDNAVQSGYGGAVADINSSSSLIENCVFSDNSASSGGAIYNSESYPSITNCTIYRNTAGSGGAISNSQANPIITNCILWDNQATSGNNEIKNVDSCPVIACSDISDCNGSGTKWPQTLGLDNGGNICAEPDFADVNNLIGTDGLWRTNDDGLRLAAYDIRGTGTKTIVSCIDAADTAPAPKTDICGNTRRNIPYIPNKNNRDFTDMGAYEAGMCWYVKQDKDVRNDGSSWSKASGSLQEILKKAQNGDEIWVAAGVYKPGSNMNDSFVIDKKIALYGGFAGYESHRDERNWLKYRTYLDGDIGESIDYSNYSQFDYADNSMCMVKIFADSFINGFVICNGYYNGGNSVKGLGIYIEGASCQISSCSIQNNNGRSAIAAFNSSVLISDSIFWGNKTPDKGGAIYSEQSSLAVKNSIFSVNAASHGSAIYINKSQADIFNSVFRENTAYEIGVIYKESSSLAMTGCLFSGNRSSNENGVIFANNGGLQYGLNLNNCSIVKTVNINGEESVGLDLNYGGFNLNNCLIWYNSIRTQYTGNIGEITASDIQGCGGSLNWSSSFNAGINGGGNIDEDPDFSTNPEFYDVVTENTPSDGGVGTRYVCGSFYVAEPNRYHLGDIVQYCHHHSDIAKVARTVVDVDFSNKRVFFEPAVKIYPYSYTQIDENIKLYNDSGELVGEDTTCLLGKRDDDFVVDGNKIDVFCTGYFVEYDDDGVMRKIVSAVFQNNNTTVYFSPSLTYAWPSGTRKGKQIVNWGKYAIVDYDANGNQYDTEYNIGNMTTKLQASVSPCIDNGYDDRVGGDTLDLDEDGYYWESVPFDIEGLPRIQRIFTGSDSVDMGALESGGLISANQTVTVKEDDPCVFNLNIQNLKGSSVSYVVVTEPKHGTLTNTDGTSVIYTPDSQYSFEENGADADEFYYKPFDGVNYGELTKVTIQEVSEINDLPVAVGDSIWLNEDEIEVSIPVLSNDYDPDNKNAQLTLIGKTDGDYGVTVFESDNTKLKYILQYSNFFSEGAGSDTFTYTCKNDNNEQDSTTVTVHANHKPTKEKNFSINAKQKTVTMINGVAEANFTDKDSCQTLQISQIIQKPDKGTVSIYPNDPCFLIYMPDAGQTESTSFTYKVKDNLGAVSDDNATVTININTVQVVEDTDKDGIEDSAEQNVFHTDYTKSDTDGDGINDGVEVASCWDATEPYQGGYYASNLPYSTAFMMEQHYNKGFSLDGQLGWKVEQGICKVARKTVKTIPPDVGDNKYTHIYGMVACLNAGETVISKQFNDNGQADNYSDIVRVKLYPTAGAQVSIYNGSEMIAGVKFEADNDYTDTPPDGNIYYWNSSSKQWIDSNKPWNKWIFATYYDYAMLLQFRFDFNTHSCNIYFDVNDSDNDEFLNQSVDYVANVPINSSCIGFDQIKFQSGPNENFEIRGLYVNELKQSSQYFEITWPKKGEILQSRVPIEGQCYGFNVIGYKLKYFPYLVDEYGRRIIDYSKVAVFYESDQMVSEVNKPLGFWNTTVLANGSYGITADIYFDEYQWVGDCCNPELVNDNNLHIYRSINYQKVNDLLTTGSVKYASFHQEEEPDLSVPWPGQFPFEFKRIYDSGRINAEQIPSFGRGWTNNMQIILVEDAKWYESSTCEKKTGGNYADSDASGLAFGAIYVQYEDSSVHLFRHTTGSVDSYETIYTPYPDDGSGDYVRRIVIGDVNNCFVPNCQECEVGCPSPCKQQSIGSGISSICYELQRADSTAITFDAIEDAEVVNVPDGAIVLENMTTYPYYPYGGAVYQRLTTSGTCGKCYGQSTPPGFDNIWLFAASDPPGISIEDLRWRFVTAVKTKSDRFGNTLNYEWKWELDPLGIYEGEPVVTKMTYAPDGEPNISIGISLQGKSWYDAVLKVGDVEKKKVHQSSNYDENHYEVSTLVGQTPKKYRSYVVDDYDRLIYIFDGKLLTNDKLDWTKRRTLIDYDNWGNFIQRADYIDTIKDEYINISSDNQYWFDGSICLLRDYWWFFFEPDSGKSRDGQCILCSTDYRLIDTPESYDYPPYRSDITIVNEKGQLRVQIPVTYDTSVNQLTKLATFRYDVNLPFTPSEIQEYWLNYDYTTNGINVAGRRITNNYQNNRTLIFTDPCNYVRQYDLVDQNIYDSNANVENVPSALADDVLVNYTANNYHDYNGFKIPTATTSYQQLVQSGTAHSKPVKTELIYTDDSYQVNSEPDKNIYLWKKRILLEEPNTWAETTYTYYENGLIDTETDPVGNVKHYDYDLNWHLKLLKLGLQPVERYYYDELGQLLLKADTQGLVTRYTYDGWGNITQMRTYHDADALDGNARPVFEPNIYNTFAARTTTIYDYDEQCRKISERTFSQEDKASQPSVPDGNVSTIIQRTQYTTAGLVSKVTQATVEFVQGQPRDTNCSTIDYGYDGKGRRLWEKTTDLITGKYCYTDHYYDYMDRDWGTIAGDWQDRGTVKCIANVYHGTDDKAYEKLFAANADGVWELQKRTDWQYDALGRNIQQIQSLSTNPYQLPETTAITDFYYDDAGNQICITDPCGNNIFADYDNANRRIREYFATGDTEPTEIKKEMVYYKNDKVKEVNSYDYYVEEENTKLLAKSQFDYDGRGRLTEVNQAVNINSSNIVTSWAKTAYSYIDANAGFIVDYNKYAGVIITDAVGKKTAIVNNETGKPVEINYPSGKIERARYNGDGSVKQKLVFDSSGNQQWIKYFYDRLNRLTDVNYPDNGKYIYTYNGLGQVTQITDNRAAIDNIGGSGKLTYEYDSLGQLSSLINQDDYKIDYTYRADGQKQSVLVTEPGVSKQKIYWTKYYFDTAGRLRSVTEPLKGYSNQCTAGFDYDLNGNRSKLSYFLNGTTTGDTVDIDYTYNKDNFLNSYNAGGNFYNPPRFGFNNSGNIDGLGRLKFGHDYVTQPNSQINTHLLDFEYDGLSQLTSASISNVNEENWTGEYNYHYNGDMSSRTINSGSPTSFAYNGNEMNSVGPNSLSYDWNGNLIAGYKEANTPVGLAYNWDNKLKSASINAEQVVSIKYDPMGNRIAKNSSVAGNRKYIVDVVGDLPVILLEIDPADMSVKKAYIYANSQIVAQYDSANNKYYYLHDRLGSVRQLINTSGAVVKLYTYNPFGEILEEQGTVDNDFKFTGQYFDKEIGQYYLRARQYSPYLSRFTGRDLIMGNFDDPMSLHKYLYCGNDPINRFDPLGQAYVDLNFSYTFGGLSNGPLGGFTLTAGVMFDHKFNDYYYFGGGYTLSAFGGLVTTLTASPDNVGTGWNLALTAMSPSGAVAQIGYTGNFSDLSSFYTDLDYGLFEWWEVGHRLDGSGFNLPKHIPKYLKSIDPKWLMKNSFKPPSDFNPKDWLKNASLSVTAFYVFDWDVFGGDWTDRAFGAAEMFSGSPVGLETRNIMMSEILDDE